MEFIKKNNVQINTEKIQVFAEKFNLNEEVVKLLFLRGIDTEDAIQKYINVGETQLYNPFLLKNMNEVVAKIRYYMSNNKRILIMGDYDTDGISASAILYKYFEKNNIHVDVFLPNRFVDGYGLTIDTINKVHSIYNPDLIITVDCGITCVEEIKHCKNLGIDIIVTDHHDIPSEIPDTLIINPKLPDQIYPFKELCGAGVALKVVQALAGLSEALNYTTIATLATVADIVPLLDENRAIVKLGLQNQKDQLPKGLKALSKNLKISLPLSSTDISFKIAPKINATGRMGDALISFKLYVENDEQEIQKYINDLLELNDLRVEKTNDIFASACEKINTSESEVVSVSPISYMLDDDGIVIADPIGKKAISLSADISIVLAKKEHIELFNSIFFEMEFERIEYISETLAQAQFVIPKEEREELCMLIDCGHLTTSVSFVQGDGILDTKTFSVGGGHISGDLSEIFELTYKDAERFKNQIVLSLQGGFKDKYEFVTESGYVEKISLNEANNAVAYRIEEIGKILEQSINEIPTSIAPYMPIYVVGSGLISIKGGKNFLAKYLGKNIIEGLVPVPGKDKSEFTAIFSIAEYALKKCK